MCKHLAQLHHPEKISHLKTTEVAHCATSPTSVPSRIRSKLLDHSELLEAQDLASENLQRSRQRQIPAVLVLTADSHRDFLTFRELVRVPSLLV